VRLWRESGQGPLAPLLDWQGEMEYIQTGQRWTFATLEELLDFLRRWIRKRITSRMSF
jgi:hypothetical protein